MCIKFNNLKLFTKSLEILADMFTSNRDFGNGFHLYNQLRVIGDISENTDLKVKALVEMADLCQLMRMLRESRLFLKKALQYVWLSQNSDKELIIYDKIGKLCFMVGDLQGAKYFHHRSMGSQVEMDTSPCKKHGLDTARKYMSNLAYKSKQLNIMILAKLGMIGDQYT